MVNLWMGVEGRIDYTRGQRNCQGCDGKVQCGGEFLGSPVVKSLHSQCREMSSIPSQGSKTLHATWQTNKKRKVQSVDCVDGFTVYLYLYICTSKMVKLNP